MSAMTFVTIQTTLPARDEEHIDLLLGAQLLPELSLDPDRAKASAIIRGEGHPHLVDRHGVTRNEGRHPIESDGLTEEHAGPFDERARGHRRRDLKRLMVAHRPLPCAACSRSVAAGWARARRTDAELTCNVLAIVSHVAGGVWARI